MIFTSNYSNWPLENGIAISADKGKDAGFVGEYYFKLAPKKSFWRKWKDSIGIVPAEENNKYYIKEYYNLVLKSLDPVEVYKNLNGKVMLCYEENDKFCHRHIAAFWLEEKLKIQIYEVTLQEDGRLIIHERPAWIKDILIQVMNES